MWEETEMTCRNCGHQMEDGAKFCTSCGAVNNPAGNTVAPQPNTAQNTPQQQYGYYQPVQPQPLYNMQHQPKLHSGFTGFLVWGSILLYLGLASIISSATIAIYDIYSYYNDEWGYNYQSPLTFHETMIFVILLTAIVLAIVGAVLLLIRRHKMEKVYS